MPRPRFDKLDPERRRGILAAAAEEFAAHGYEAASYNRIIERCGLSKGAVYYYFDDKQDLYVTVLRDALQRLVLDASEMGRAKDTDGFWREYRAWSLRSLHRFQADPTAVSLARGLAGAVAGGKEAGGALAELRTVARGWLLGFIAQGQELGAVRTDLPQDLLVTILLALEEGTDLWLGARIGDMSARELERLAGVFTDLYRRVLGPASPASKKTKAGGGNGQRGKRS